MDRRQQRENTECPAVDRALQALITSGVKLKLMIKKKNRIKASQTFGPKFPD